MTILFSGKHAQLTKRLELLAIEQFGSDENEEEIPSKRRRITEKVYEKEAEEIPSAKVWKEVSELQYVKLSLLSET